MTIGILVTSFNKAPFVQLFCVVEWQTLGRVLMVVNIFHFTIIEVTVELQSFDAEAGSH